MNPFTAEVGIRQLLPSLGPSNAVAFSADSRSREWCMRDDWQFNEEKLMPGVSWRTAELQRKTLVRSNHEQAN